MLVVQHSLNVLACFGWIGLAVGKLTLLGAPTVAATTTTGIGGIAVAATSDHLQKCHRPLASWLWVDEIKLRPMYSVLLIIQQYIVRPTVRTIQYTNLNIVIIRYRDLDIVTV
jgi:hypothetical protein